MKNIHPSFVLLRTGHEQADQVQTYFNRLWQMFAASFLTLLTVGCCVVLLGVLLMKPAHFVLSESDSGPVFMQAGIRG